MTRNHIAASTALATLFAVLPAVAQQTQVAETAAEMEEIVVYGRGEARQVQTVTAQALSLEAPGSSPLKAIEKLPGVSFQSADAFGAYEWSTRISIRGFNQNQLGFTLDGVPLGDMSYGNYNGLHISRAISSENIGTITVAQGSGTLGTASTSNLGGTLQFVSRDPDREGGIFLSGTGGSESTWRGFARLETGDLDSGTRGFLSYGRQRADKWKGAGVQKQQQVNAKAIQNIGEEATLTVWVNYSDRAENDYQDLSLDMIRRLGSDWDNFAPDWATALRVADIYNGLASGPFPAPVTTVDDAYYDAAGLRKDLIGAATLRAPLMDIVRVEATGYGHRNEGQGLWFTPYVPTPTPGGAPMSIRTTEYDIGRIGGIGQIFVEIPGGHTLNGGVWFEQNDFSQARRFYGLDRTGPRSSTDFLSNPFATQWSYDFETETRQFHLQDTWHAMDWLTVNAGFKAVKVTNSVVTKQGAPVRSGEIEVDDGFLPQAGFAADVFEGHQIFGSYAENMGAFVAAATSGPFSTSQEGFEAIRNSLKPERSRTFELGWRFNVGRVQGVVAGYDVKFDNRLLAVTLGPGIVGNPAALQNVGAVRTRGFEAAATVDVIDNLSLFGSYTYNDSTYRNDVRDGTGAVTAATRGKTVVNTPENLFRAELAWDDGALFAKVGASYTGERFYTYLNDSPVDGYTTVDMTLGYRVEAERLGVSTWLDGLTVQLNVTNLTGEDYVATLGSNGFVNSDPLGTTQTLLPGAPRQFSVNISKKF